MYNTEYCYFITVVATVPVHSLTLLVISKSMIKACEDDFEKYRLLLAYVEY